MIALDGIHPLFKQVPPRDRVRFCSSNSASTQTNTKVPFATNCSSCAISAAEALEQCGYPFWDAAVASTVPLNIAHILATKSTVISCQELTLE